MFLLHNAELRRFENSLILKSLVSNSTHHSWHGKLPSFSSFGATVNSLIKILKKLAVSARDCSTSDAITCSPNAEIK